MGRRLSLAFAAACSFAFCLPSEAMGPFTQLTIDPDNPPDPWMKAVGDLDGDGLPDPIVVGRAGPAVWYRSPDFTKHVISDGGGGGTDVTAADVDGDGDLDVALANGSWFENPRPLGDPMLDVWGLHRITGQGHHDIVASDLDGDGDLDLVTRNQYGLGHELRVFRQEDGADLWTIIELPAVPDGEGLALGDVDGDGDDDIVIADRWYENDGTLDSGAWTVRLFTGLPAYGDTVVAVGDIDGDGHLDVAAAPSEFAGGIDRIVWYEAPVDPRTQLWTEHVIVEPVETIQHSAQLADLDGDGDLDFLTAETHQGTGPVDEVEVYENLGGGQSWARHVVSTEGSHSLQVADFDGDGDLDFFGANWDSGSAPDGGAVKVWRNDGPPPITDGDGDGVPDPLDNCTEQSNPSQLDTDRDGYGNACDGDFDNNGRVDGADLLRVFLPDFRSGRDAGSGTDEDGDGDVDASDFMRFRNDFLLGAPGPSGLECAGAPPCGGP